MFVLVLESSTSSAKAMVYDTNTGNYEIKTKAYPNLLGTAERQDGDKVFGITMELGREISAGRNMDMIALGGAWHSVMLCDRNMEPISPVYHWPYTGAAGICERLREDHAMVKAYYNKTGCMVNATYPMFKLELLKGERDLSQCYIMGQGTYTTYRLTGKRVITACMASGSGLLNIHNKVWEESLLEYLGITEAQLCDLIPYNATYPLNKEGAALLGQKEGTPVIPANSDGGLNQMGVGAVKEGVMTFSVGTSGALRLSAKKAVIPEEPSTWCYLSPKSWMSGAATAGCCNCIDWFRNQLAGGRGYSELEMSDSMIRDTPVFLPFLFGERCPGWNDQRLGGFEEIRPYHNIRDMYRAVQEGILFNLYHCYQILRELNGEPTRVMLSGGILQSRVWRQMCADIFQKEMEIEDIPHGSLLGGAVLAMELSGVISDVSEYESRRTETIEPIFENRSVYQEKFERYLEYYNGAVRSGRK